MHLTFKIQQINNLFLGKETITKIGKKNLKRTKRQKPTPGKIWSSENWNTYWDNRATPVWDDQHDDNILPGWASPGKNNHYPAWPASKAEEAEQDLQELLLKLTALSKNLKL